MTKKIEIYKNPLIKLRALSFAIFISIISACGNSLYARHSFSFDASTESPDIEVIDYEYGNSKQPGVRVSSYEKQKAHYVARSTNVNGYMLKGDWLYVKWRIKKTGKIYEDHVDLKNKVPSSLEDYRIHFQIKYDQLYVYLVFEKEKIKKGSEIILLKRYSDLKTEQIYPK